MSDITVNNSLEFRPPLHAISASTGRQHNNKQQKKKRKFESNLKSDAGEKFNVDDDDDINKEIRPLLYRMYIACHVLRLGTEARFSALVFLHRYVMAKRSIGREHDDGDDDDDKTSRKNHSDGQNHRKKKKTRDDAADTTAQSLKGQQEKSNDEWTWIAAACLFLACKAEEQPRRLRDVINLAHMILSSSSVLSSPSTTTTETKSSSSSSSSSSLKKSQGTNVPSDKNLSTTNATTDTTGSTHVRYHPHNDPDHDNWNETHNKNNNNDDDDDDDGNNNNYYSNSVSIVLQNNPPQLNKAYWESKKKLVETEQRVLRWLTFDVSVSHPHRVVSILLQNHHHYQQQQQRRRNYQNQDQQSHNDNNNIDTSNDFFMTPTNLEQGLLPIAFRLLNDALFYSPALQHPVLPLACAAIELAQEEAAAIQTGEQRQNRKRQQPQHEMKTAATYVSDSNIEQKTEKESIDDINEEQHRQTQQRRLWSSQYKLTEESIVLAKQDLITATTILTRKRSGT